MGGADSVVGLGVGFRVLRFWNNEVLRDTDAVMETIWQDLQTRNRTPIPTLTLPLKGREC